MFNHWLSMLYLEHSCKMLFVLMISVQMSVLMSCLTNFAILWFVNRSVLLLSLLRTLSIQQAVLCLLVQACIVPAADSSCYSYSCLLAAIALAEKVPVLSTFCCLHTGDDATLYSFCDIELAILCAEDIKCMMNWCYWVFFVT